MLRSCGDVVVLSASVALESICNVAGLVDWPFGSYKSIFVKFSCSGWSITASSVAVTVKVGVVDAGDLLVFAVVSVVVVVAAADDDEEEESFSFVG